MLTGILGHRKGPFFRIEQGVTLRNPVPHACFRKNLDCPAMCQALPYPLSRAKYIFCLFCSRFRWSVLVCNLCMVQQQLSSFSPSTAYPSPPQRWSCPSESDKMLNRPSHRIQIICPTQMVKHRSLGAIHVFVRKRTAPSFSGVCKSRLSM